MASNINPSLTPVNSLDNFRFWCQKVLPLVYDDSLSYYEVLGKMVVQLNDVIDNVNADTDNVLTLKDAFLELQTYVNNFFDDIEQLASYAERAEAAQTAANTSAVNAASSASNASASSLAAMDARDTAVAARQAAQASANTASTAATNANTKANEAAQSAITAQTAQASASQSATLAATDRSAAQTAASTATTKASEANASATNAAESATNAEQSKDDAKALVNNVQESLDNIQQNTQDILNIKGTLGTFPIEPISVLTLEEYGEDNSTSVAGRTIGRKGNKFTTRGYSSNTSYKSTNLFGTIGTVDGDGIPTTLTYAESLALPNVLSGLEVYAVCKYALISGGGNVSRIKFYNIDENESATLIGQQMMDGTNGIVMYKIDKTKHFNAVIWTRNSLKNYDFEISLVAYPVLDTAALALALENN